MIDGTVRYTASKEIMIYYFIKECQKLLQEHHLGVLKVEA